MRILFFLLSLCLLLVLFAKPVSAQEIKAVTIVNPIRGGDFWEYAHSRLQTPKKQLEVIQRNRLSATWLVRFDALKDPEVIAFLKSLPASHEVGLLLEITPTLAQDAGVPYNESLNWHYAKSIFTIGYTPADREKLIDTAVRKFTEVTGKPLYSVGAWWIDAKSLQLLKDKYGVIANLDVADQFSTDQYQVWGQYFSLPFYPSKQNALVPTENVEKKIGVVTIQWATRDPFNSYGNGVGDSTYSVQANDYLLHDLDTGYFEKLLKIYPQVTVGLENDFNWDEFGNEYTRQIELIGRQQNQRLLTTPTMHNYAERYIQRNPDMSPNVLLQADDPLETEGKVVWYQTSRYRVGWFYTSEGSVIRDLRTYGNDPETCLDAPCQSLNLANIFLSSIDDVSFGNRWIIDEGKLSNITAKQGDDTVEINYINSAGTRRSIKFLPNDIKVDDRVYTIAVAISNAATRNQGASGDQNFQSTFSLSAFLPGFVFQGMKFLFFIALFLFLPGWVLTRRYSLAIPVGISLFTLASYLLGYLHFGIALWFVGLFGIFGSFLVGPPKLRSLKMHRYQWIAVGVILVGSLSWILTTVKNGLLFNYGYGFWGANGHDAIWHLSLVSELQRNVPPDNPIFAGEALHNYHYFYNLLVAQASQLFQLNILDAVFRLFPLLIALLAGTVMYKVTKQLYLLFNKDMADPTSAYIAGIAGTFFLYFGGSLGWMVSFWREGNLGGESLFWAQQGISTLINPPFAISVVLFLTGLILFLDLLSSQTKARKIILGVTMAIVWGTLIEFKAYAGVLVLTALGLYAVDQIVTNKNWRLIPLVLLTGVIAAGVFLPNNSGSSSLILFQPLWLVESMILSPDRLGWQRLALAYQTDSWIKVWGSLGLGIFFFVVGNLGTRLIGLASWKTLVQFRFLTYFIIIGGILPLLFVQLGTNWNIVQFFYYSMLGMSILAGVTIGSFFRKLPPLAALGLGLIIILLTIPTTLNGFNHYLPNRPPAMLPKQEIEALEFLQSQPRGIVLTIPFDDNVSKQFPAPKPLSMYTSTAYVSAFSQQPVFMEDTTNLEILGIDYKGRLNTARDILRIRSKTKELLAKNDIAYIYLPKAYQIEVEEERMGIKQIFENEVVRVFKVEE